MMNTTTAEDFIKITTEAKESLEMDLLEEEIFDVEKRLSTLTRERDLRNQITEHRKTIVRLSEINRDTSKLNSKLHRLLDTISEDLTELADSVTGGQDIKPSLDLLNRVIILIDNRGN